MPTLDSTALPLPTSLHLSNTSKIYGMTGVRKTAPTTPGWLNEHSISLPYPLRKFATSLQLSDSFSIFLIFWAPLSLAALYITPKRIPFFRHNTTPPLHTFSRLTCRFTTPQNRLMSSWPPCSFASLSGGRVERGGLPVCPYLRPVIKLSRLPCFHRRHHHG